MVNLKAKKEAGVAQPFRACVTAQKNSRGSLQPSVTSGPGSPVPSSGLLGTKHARGIYT